MKKFLAILMALVMILALVPASYADSMDDLVAAAQAEGELVVYGSCEEEYLTAACQHFEELFGIKVNAQRLSTGEVQAKIEEENGNPSADVWFGGTTDPYNVCATEGLLEAYEATNAAHLTSDMYRDADGYWYGIYKGILGFMVNTDELTRLGLEAPADWTDLLKDEYKGLIEMPNPTASSTGYLYLKSLVNAWGEDEAFAYFDKLDANILKYTDSGSGPIKDLEAGECAIGLSLTFNAVEAINEGAPLDIIFFEEGAPYSPTGCAIISGRETDPAVQAVFSYLYSGVQDEYLATYLPEQVKIDQKTDIENFPSDIPYADMSNDTPDVKTALLDKWAY